METNPATLSTANSEPNFFLPRGRIGVRSMFIRGSACYLLLFILGFLLKAVSIDAGHGITTVPVYLLVVFMVITSIKRGHDMGYSGAAIIILILWPFLLLLPGARGENRFGPPPTRWW